MAANLHIPFLCLKGKPNKKSARIFCVRQVYFTSKTSKTSKSWRQIWWRVNQPFKHTFFHHVWGKQSAMRRSFFIIQTSDRICSFFALFKPKILQFSQFCKTNCTHSKSRTIQVHASFAQQIDLVTVFDAILTSRQTREKLQCLYENLMSNNFGKTALLKNI